MRFHQSVQDGVDRLWKSQASMALEIRPKGGEEALLGQLRLLAPKDAAQTEAKTAAVPVIIGLQQKQW